MNAPLNKPPFKKAFMRAQLASLVATTLDFSSSLILYHLLSVYYVTATTLGSVLGAVINFLLSRNWVFLNRHGHIRKQIIRFFIINTFSIFANTTGVFFFKENFEISFLISRIIVAVLIGIFFNFFMNRYFVFR